MQSRSLRRPLPWLIVALSALTGACAEVAVDEADGGEGGDTGGELAGRSGGDPAVPGVPSLGPVNPSGADAETPKGEPQDAGLPESDADGAAAVGAVDADGSPGGCVPGTRLGLCVVCGDDGAPTTAADDDACPATACDGDGVPTFARTEDADGNRLCTESRPTGAAAGRCQAAGQCRPAGDTTGCDAPETLEAARATGPCQDLEGCVGGTGPTLAVRPVGTPCNGAGQCQADGTCSREAVTCAHFTDAIFCAEGVDGRPWCELYVRGTNCGAYCSRFGVQCLDAFSEVDDSCVHEDQIACNRDFEDGICRCALPQ